MTLNDRLAQLRAQFRQRIEREGREILALAEARPPSAEEVQRLRFLSHSLAGSAPMFDYPAVGEAALEVEDAVREAAAAGRAVSEAERAELEAAAARFATSWKDALSG